MKSLYLILFSVLLALSFALDIPSAEYTQFHPPGGKMNVPPELNLTITIDLRNELNQSIAVDDVHPAYDAFSCTSDRNYVIEKWVDSEGKVVCHYDGLIWDRSVFEIKYGSEVYQTYIVGHPKEIANATTTTLRRISWNQYAGEEIRADITPRNGNGFSTPWATNVNIANTIKSDSGIVITGGSVNMNTESIVTLHGVLPTTSKNHSINLYYIHDGQKVYIYNGTFFVSPKHQISIEKSVIQAPIYLYTNRFPNIDNIFDFIVRKDMYGNDKEFIDSTMHIKVYHPIHNTLLWSSPPLYGSEKTKLILKSNTVDIPYIGQARIAIHRASSSYEMQYMGIIY